MAQQLDGVWRLTDTFRDVKATNDVALLTACMRPNHNGQNLSKLALFITCCNLVTPIQKIVKSRR
jgi:hypothetical protein